MRHLLCVLTALAVVVTGCTKSQPAPPPTESPSPSPSPSPEPPPVAPLTGEEVSDALDGPVLGIKIDNAEAARPPDGLDAADIVIEEEVEGGLTRFLALVHSTDPERIGPVRSGRSVDADLLPPFKATLVLSGASARTDAIFAEAGLPVIEDDDLPEAFSRASDRPAPHNLFAETAALFERAGDAQPPQEPVFAFSEDTPSDGDQTRSAHIEFSSFVSATWTWDRGERRWTREQNGSPHVTADDATIAADNVVIMRIETRPGEERDSGGNPTVELDVIGRGRGVVLRDGRAYQMRWRKPSAEASLQWLTMDGEPLPLRPGQTWVELLSADGSLNLEQPSTGDDATEQSGD